MTGTVRQMGLLTVMLLLTACGRQHDDDDGPAAAAKSSASPAAEAALSATQSQLMGLKVETLTATVLRDEIQGQAQVLAHEALAQVLADVGSAEAAAQQSSAALHRVTDLAATPGALGADALEQAQRQARVDAVQLQLAQRRVSSQFGVLPWSYHSPQVAALADGHNKLVQVVLPTGGLGGKSLTLSFAALDDAARGRWHATAHWSAPVAAGVTGLSLYAVVAGSDLTEGSRLVALAETGTSMAAVHVPAAAVVVHNGESWCYVQTAEGQFQRRHVDTSHPQREGYAVAEGLHTGEQVVVQGAGLLLAREFGQEAGET